jgi:hypothetical protein
MTKRLLEVSVAASVLGRHLRETEMCFGANRCAVDALEHVCCRDSPKAIDQLAVVPAMACPVRPTLRWRASTRGVRAGPEVRQRVQASRDAFVAGRDQVIEFGEKGGNAAGPVRGCWSCQTRRG